MKKIRSIWRSSRNYPARLAHGETEQEALETALAVKDEWLEATFDAKWEIPEPVPAIETTGRTTLRLPKSVHARVIDRAEAEGVSINALLVTFIVEGLKKDEVKVSFAQELEQRLTRILDLERKVDSISTFHQQGLISWTDISTERGNELSLHELATNWYHRIQVGSCAVNSLRTVLIGRTSKQWSDALTEPTLTSGPKSLQDEIDPSIASMKLQGKLGRFYEGHY